MLCDISPVVHGGMLEIFRTTHDITVVATSAPGGDPLPLLRTHDPDLVIADRRDRSIETLAIALRYEEAAAALREAAQLRPFAPEIALHTGILACRRARWKDAVAPLRSAVASLPEHPGAHYHLGEALNKCDDLAGALTAYLRAVELDPTMWRALKGVGIAYDRLGKPEQAAPYYRRARDAQRA